ncbi:MAG: Flp pilus assembly protein CpaB [Burkholderiaceae bacterium]|nr:Flp pilus assembly protein CpaB [Burkholderiaceae bacterium]
MSTTIKFVLLVVGAAVLALAARMIYANMNQPNLVSDPSVQVQIAAGDLPAGLLLRSEDLDWKRMRRSQVPEGALLQGSPEAAALVGGLLRRTTPADAIVQVRDVIRPDAPGFLAAALKPGMRAVSVPVDNVSGNAGLIQPGDYVDMILIQEARASDSLDSNRARSVVSETVVEKVRVIAVGSVFQHQADDAKGNTKTAPARTVTIEVLPRAAEAVTVASRLGTLSLALRSFAVTDRDVASNEPSQVVVAWGDSTEKSAPVWAGDVSRAIDAHQEIPVNSHAPAPAVPREITILRGSKRDTQDIGSAQAAN